MPPISVLDAFVTLYCVIASFGIVDKSSRNHAFDFADVLMYKRWRIKGDEDGQANG